MVDTHSKKKGEQEEVATLTLAKNNNERELIAGRQGECTLAIGIGIRIGIGVAIAIAILCLHVSSSSPVSVFTSFLRFFCCVSFSISFSIYSVLISVLILRRKLLQRPKIVYQNDKMELSSGARAGANVFENISPWLLGLQIDLAAGCRT